jgi:hypothetical protein
MKALGIAAAAAIAFAPFSAAVVISPAVAEAAPCSGAGSNPASCQRCLFWVELYRTSNVCDHEAPPRTVQAPPSRVPEPTPEAPAPPLIPVPVLAPPSPPPPSLLPVQTPKINPPAPGVPINALVAPPKGLGAPPQAVAAAKAAPATRVNPTAPPPPTTQVDFDHLVQNVINNHSDNVDVVNADNQSLFRPRHWDYIDYDEYHRPALYNPFKQAMTFRYLYDGAYRESSVPAGGRIMLDVATVGLYPFTAVGDSYLASGSFYGGAWIPPDGWTGPPPPDYHPPAPPEVYQNVSTFVPAANLAVQIGQVKVVGRDVGQPVGSQDTFLLDDSTVAWGQVDDPNSNAQIKVNKTQSLPGVGPTDNGAFLVMLAAHDSAQPAQANQPNPPWWSLAPRYGGLAIAVGLIAWVLNRVRRNGAEDSYGLGGEQDPSPPPVPARPRKNPGPTPGNSVTHDETHV